LGTRAESDNLQRLAAVEYRHIELEPEGEREEVRQIFRSKGFAGEDLARLVELVTSDRARWVRTMLTEEYGLPQQVRSPWLAAFSTFSAFLVCGLVPLLPYLFKSSHPLTLSVVMTGGVFFLIGSAKSRWSMSPWWSSGILTLALGAIAAALAYAVGLLLNQLAQTT